MVENEEMELSTSSKLVHNLNLLCLHIENLYEVDEVLDIEPIMLIYFQKMAQSKQSKDVLSKVSRQFFKDLKLNYRLIPNLSMVMRSVLKLFEGQAQLMMSQQASFSSGRTPRQVAGSTVTSMPALDLGVDQQINESFIQFMFLNACEVLVEEHQKFMFTLVNRKNYAIQENVDKFKEELVRFNHFSAIVAHIEFDHCKFFAVRVQREIHKQSRRLCEIVDTKIQRVLEEQWRK